MGSVEAANRFVNCVMNRTRYDTVLRSLLIFALVLSPALAILFGAAILIYKDNLTYDLGRFLSQIGSTFIFYSEMFVVFFIYRRVIDHSSRDVAWRSSLIDYAESKGCNIGKMVSLNDEIKQKERSIAEKPAIVLILLLFVSIILFVGCPDMFNIETKEAINVTVVTLLAFFVSFIMTCIVLTYLVRTPYLHESMQIEFITEFADVMEPVGIRIPMMERMVKPKKIGKSLPVLMVIFGAVFIILYLFTLGLFALVPMYRSYVDTNYHIMNQWDYEIKLMETIISNEGGVGVILKEDTGVTICG